MSNKRSEKLLKKFNETKEILKNTSEKGVVLEVNFKIGVLVSRKSLSDIIEKDEVENKNKAA